MGPMVLSQLATGLSVLAGAVLVKSVMDQKPMAGPFTRCPTCNGTGRVTCLCSRWSDGDVGCSTCSGSGRMACSSCGGSGTGRPLPAKIAIRPPNRPINYHSEVFKLEATVQLLNTRPHLLLSLTMAFCNLYHHA
ncbi:hypothetical protein HKD37_18G049292 [Glycine soja]|nr:hypothetical protein JHK87_048628 [Glycine soja]